MNFFRKFFPTFAAFFSGVSNRLESAYQQWGVRRWQQTTYQDARFEFDFSAVREVCRKHLDLVENTPIVAKIRNLKIQFAVGVGGLKVVPNASDADAVKVANRNLKNAQAELKSFVGVADYADRRNDYRKALKNLIQARKVCASTAEELEDWNETRGERWEAWAKSPELGSNLSLGELSIQWEGMLFDVGNVLVQKTRDEQGRPKIQTIDFLRLQTPPALARLEGKEIIQGVRLTKIKVPVKVDGKTITREVMTGKPFSYFIRDEFDQSVFIEVSADQIIHKFRAIRPGMMVGLPEAYSVINKIIDYTDLHILEMSASKLAGEIANVWKTPSGEFDTQSSRRTGMKIQTQGPGGTAGTKNYSDFYQVTVGAKDYAIPIGADIKNFQINRPTVAQQDYWQHILSEICAGYNVPKLLVFPFSLQGTVTRADLDVCANAFRGDFEIIASIAREIYEWQTTWAIHYDKGMDGKVPAQPLGCVIRPPRSPNVDIGYTAKALEIELRLGVKSLQDVYADQNKDWRVELRQVAESMAFIKRLEEEFGLQPGQLSSLEVPEPIQDPTNKPDQPEGNSEGSEAPPTAELKHHAV